MNDLFNDKQKLIWTIAYYKHHRIMLIFIFIFLLFYSVMLLFFPLVLCLFVMVYLVICRLNRQSYFYADQLLASYYSKSFMKGCFMYHIKRVGEVNKFFILS